METLSTTSPALRLAAEVSGRRLVARIVGELDLAGRESMERLATWVASQPDDAPLVIDLSATTFIDSSGLRMLLDAAAGRRSVALCSPSPAVARVLDLTGLRGRFAEVTAIDDPVPSRDG